MHALQRSDAIFHTGILTCFLVFKPDKAAIVSELILVLAGDQTGEAAYAPGCVN
jgi:hypothetical protein